jgi:hypothetical protein
MYPGARLAAGAPPLTPLEARNRALVLQRLTRTQAGPSMISSSYIVIIGRPRPMPRTIIDIPDGQLREINRVCRALKISRAEAVRRGVNAFLERNQTVEEDGYGLWRDTKVEARCLLATIQTKW